MSWGMLVNKFCDIGWRKVIHCLKTHYEYFKMMHFSTGNQ